MSKAIKAFLIKHHILRELYYQMDGIPSIEIPTGLILLYSFYDYKQQKGIKLPSKVDRLLQRTWDKWYSNFMKKRDDCRKKQELNI